jgi:cell division protein ZapA
MGRKVELRIAGQTYRVVSSAPEEELQRLAAVVSDKLTEVVGKNRGSPPQAMLLAAMALAHEAEAQRERCRKLERKTRDLMRRMLSRIDQTLESFEPPDSVPPS